MNELGSPSLVMMATFFVENQPSKKSCYHVMHACQKTRNVDGVSDGKHVSELVWVLKGPIYCKLLLIGMIHPIQAFSVASRHPLSSTGRKR